MRINKKEPRHWVYLLLFTVHILCASIARIINKNRTPRTIILYGHKLNGNLYAIYNYIKNNPSTGLDVAYMTMDVKYARVLKALGVDVFSCISLSDMVIACQSSIYVTDHGPHALIILKLFSDVKFIDVWHGIPFKGFDENDFKLLHLYNAVFVTSLAMQAKYIDQFGFRPDAVVITGYPRTDCLIKQEIDTSGVLDDLGIKKSSYRAIILLAPTWTHHRYGQAPDLMNMSEIQFLQQLCDAMKKRNILVIYRAHLNAAESDLPGLKNLISCPLAKYENTEALLSVSDILISDWSSIVFDYLLLMRPTLFIDRENPFDNGFTFGPEYRFGPVTSSLDELVDAIDSSLDIKKYMTEWNKKMKEVKTKLYGEYADGKSTKRSVNEILRFIQGAQS
jgi:CDP-glycerol glycerophosphotransferase (TagB/SpsB family)